MPLPEREMGVSVCSPLLHQFGKWKKTVTMLDLFRKVLVRRKFCEKCNTFIEEKLMIKPIKLSRFYYRKVVLWKKGEPYDYDSFYPKTPR